MNYKLTEEDLKIIGNSISDYLNGSIKGIPHEAFDSVTDGDVGFSFYKEQKTFHGNYKFPGTFKVKGLFEGRVGGSVIFVEEQGTSNNISINM